MDLALPVGLIALALSLVLSVMVARLQDQVRELSRQASKWSE